MRLKAKWAQGVLILLTALAGWYIGQRQTLFALVKGNSMEPTLHSGQLLHVYHGLPQQIPRGTIVLVSRFPLPPFVKRVVGLPHEIISFHLGSVFIDRKMLREQHLSDGQGTFAWKYDQLTPRDDEYVLLGDNRLSSQDSREFGVVARDRIIAGIDLP